MVQYSSVYSSVSSNTSSSITPPLSPVLLLGLAVRPLPLRPLQPLLATAMRTVMNQHPDVFERLSDLENPRFFIDPVDLPFGFLLVADPDQPSLTALPKSADVRVAATIRGPLITLTKMLEGKIDGDAQFFSRDLVVEGDTEAVVALRNAVDGSEIDLFQSALDRLGVLSVPVERASHFVKRLYDSAVRDLDYLRRAATAPTERMIDIQAAKIKRLEEKLASQKKSVRKRT